MPGRYALRYGTGHVHNYLLNARAGQVSHCGECVWPRGYRQSFPDGNGRHLPIKREHWLLAFPFRYRHSLVPRLGVMHGTMCEVGRLSRASEAAEKRGSL